MMEDEVIKLSMEFFQLLPQLEFSVFNLFSEVSGRQQPKFL